MLGSGAACKAKTVVSVKPWGFVNSRRKSWTSSQPRHLDIALEEALLWMLQALEPDEGGKASPGELQLVERRWDYGPHMVQEPQNGPPAIPTPRGPSAKFGAQAGPPQAWPMGQDSSWI